MLTDFPIITLFNQIISNGRGRHGKKVFAYNINIYLFFGQMLCSYDSCHAEQTINYHSFKRGGGKILKSGDGSPFQTMEWSP